MPELEGAIKMSVSEYRKKSGELARMLIWLGVMMSWSVVAFMSRKGSDERE